VAALLQLHLIKEGIKTAIDDAPIELVLAVEPGVSTAPAIGRRRFQWCRQA